MLYYFQRFEWEPESLLQEYKYGCSARMVPVRPFDWWRSYVIKNGILKYGHIFSSASTIF
jgi:hypothetical protein